MSAPSSESESLKMDVNEEVNDLSNGLGEPMEVDSDEKKGQKTTSESIKPGKIAKKPRPSNSSVSSDKSGGRENGKEGEFTKATEKDTKSDDEDDFLGFPGPTDTSARDQFHAFVGKEAETTIADDDALSQASEDPKSDKSDNDDSDSESPPTRPVRKSVTRRSVSTDKINEKPPVDNKKPFEFGWVREVVYRLSGTSSNKRRADVYYYTPAGKKIRSLVDITDHLAGDLTLEHFTFHKEPLGLNDSSKEIIREARSLKQAEENAAQKLQQQQHRASTPSTKLKLKSVTESQVKSPTTPKVSLKSANKKPSVGKKPDNMRKSAVHSFNSENDDSEEGDWDVVQKNPTREVCSIECRLAMGLIPTLQCVSCLCLYHPECVGIQQDKLSPSKPYSCKNCQNVSGQSSSQTQAKPVSATQPPPLVPLNPPTSATPPRKSAPKPDPKTNPNRQNIVGTVTTWLPSSSSIQVSQSSPTPKTSTTSTTMTTAPTSSTKPSASDGPHQGLLELGGNTFVVIPRHNVVNVSNQTSSAPAVAATANAANAVSTVNPQTQTNGILLVPLSVQPPDSTLADVSTTQNPVAKSVNPGTSAVETNGLKPRTSDSSMEEEPRSNVKLKEIPPKYQRNPFFALTDATTMSLFSFFQYLKVHELLRATQVNKTWNLIATHQSLWETVRMKNSKVRDFVGFGNALRRYNTKSLDLRKMITPESPEGTNEMWTELGSVISTLPNLKRVDFGRCSPSAIEVVASACSHLESITSVSIRGTELNMAPIANCLNLVELKLKSFGGFDAKNIASLKQLTNLKTLVLTTVRNLEGIENALPESLETLELGECMKLHEKFATVALPKLVNLKRLRLEKGQGSVCPTLAMLQTISSLPNLAQLELINFDIKPGFDKALSKCTNVKILLIIPTYVTQSATTNHVVMGGVSKLSGSLQYFIWGLTLELLRVTDLFIDQVEGGKSKSGGTASGKKTGTGDSIPILKPLSDEGAESNREGSASQVDILGLPKLQRVLSTLLPQTKIKILKIPFSATWRQTVSDVPA